jgi:uncharacterized protein YjbI with pentapeptide repeats
MLRPQTDTTSQALAAPIRPEVATISQSLKAKRCSFIVNSLPLVYDSQNYPMDEEHPAKRKKSRWWSTSRGALRIFAALIAVGTLLVVFLAYFLENLGARPLTVLGAATVVAAVVVLILVGQQYKWTGFGESVQPKPDNQEIQPRKTLWDWLQLFIVPLALAAIGLWFSAQQDVHQQQIEKKRAMSDLQIEERRAQDAALQAYLDQMSQLMLERKLLGSDEGDEVRTLAQARTRTILTRLDGRRKGSVVQFLYEASLINKNHPVVSLSSGFLPPELESESVNVGLRGADLRGADLREADLSYADLSEAKLSGANLSDANLSEAQLINANLSWAPLSGADLSGTNLSEANLRFADLIDANLNGANLSDANLSEADLPGAKLRGAYLFNADLNDAKGVTEEQLENQTDFLEGATMPDGSMHD